MTRGKFCGNRASARFTSTHAVRGGSGPPAAAHGLRPRHRRGVTGRRRCASSSRRTGACLCQPGGAGMPWNWEASRQQQKYGDASVRRTLDYDGLREYPAEDASAATPRTPAAAVASAAATPDGTCGCPQPRDCFYTFSRRHPAVSTAQTAPLALLMEEGYPVGRLVSSHVTSTTPVLKQTLPRAGSRMAIPLGQDWIQTVDKRTGRCDTRYVVSVTRSDPPE